MRKLLEKAVSHARSLPDDDQDALAIAILATAEAKSPLGRVSV
jgi:hypothetical protein